ncbi:IclR family transcriptional regulator [Arthrobacter koreensis]|uniref:IclR family transcriptional regulator n=1 Tax=Arthrobacter koreensis TaxID=199136 RepID=A0ABY6FQY4_9MICC|nr:IclR family transcriptional regulator [Arthrobacter koreensis]UYB35615.1 IclR family transcriptional regulator [Arthrobacter koreensis]
MSSPTRPIEALARGLKILEVLSRATGSMGNGQLSRATGLPPSTVSRLTDSLVQLGYLRVSSDSGAYYLTPKNLRLGYPVLVNLPIAGRARRALDSLADTTGFTAALATRDGLHMTFMSVTRPRNSNSVNLAVGGRLPISVSAAGLAFVAASEEPEKSRLTSSIRYDLERRGQPVTPFEERLAAASGRYVSSIGGWNTDLGGVAVPVRCSGELYALTLIARTSQLEAADIAAELVPPLLQSADYLAD